MHRWRRVAVAGFLFVFLAAAIGSPARAALGGYTDIETHWGRGVIEELLDLGALDDGPPLFGPDEAASRGKVARYLTLGWGVEPYTLDREFLADVPLSHPYFPYVNALYVRRLMVGVGGGLFGVDDPLTREQAATVLVRAAGLELDALSLSLAEAEDAIARYSDAAQVSEWALPYVAQAYLAGLFKGDKEGTFRPLDSLTKAEAATVVSRVRVTRQLMDFGDAPDRRPYFGFPSLMTSDGARHLDWRSVWLGRLADGEIDSRQINDDSFDDGLVAFIPGPDPDTYRLVFTVSVASRDTTLYGTTDDKALFFNLLVDSDLSMVWEPEEWVVQNMKINPNAWPAGQMSHTYTTVAFSSAVHPLECWSRLTLTWGEKVPAGWVGTGSFVYGETEDYGPEEQKLLVRDDISSLVGEWEASPDPNRRALAALLEGILPLMDDLILEEQSDDPVNILIAKKEVILALLYIAAEQAHQLGMSQADIDRVFEAIWKRMAYVTEEEAKRYAFDLLREAMRLSFRLPVHISSAIEHALDQLLDLMWEQQIKHPQNVLLAKKDRIISTLEDLLVEVNAAGLDSAARRIQTALSTMKLIKLLEQPVPPGQPPHDPPADPPGDDPGDDPSGPPAWGGEAPPLPPLITGVGGVHEYRDGRIVIKVHITSIVETPVHDLEIYYEHQPGWAGGSLTPVAAPEGWESTSGPAGVRFYGETPLVPCTPVFIGLDYDGENVPDYIVIVVTDIDSKPIGHGGSQRVRSGFIELRDGEPANIDHRLGGMDSFFDVFTEMDLGGAQLRANSELAGGIQALAGPLPLLPGGYLPVDGYDDVAGPIVVGEYYALRDHTGDGYALLLAISAGPDGCVFHVEYNPAGNLMMVHY